MTTPSPALYRIAIVGAGPAGLYAAGELLRRDAADDIRIFDRLSVAGGLVRFGVAPDHPFGAHSSSGAPPCSSCLLPLSSRPSS